MVGFVYSLFVFILMIMRWVSIRCRLAEMLLYCTLSQVLGGCAIPCHDQHACIFLFSWTTSGKSTYRVLTFFKWRILFLNCFIYSGSLSKKIVFIIMIQFEQVDDMKVRALAIALPFACILGLLAAVTASSMGMPWRRSFFLNFHFNIRVWHGGDTWSWKLMIDALHLWCCKKLLLQSKALKYVNFTWHLNFSVATCSE